jgi:ubiquinone/menaquinone biosynthesis C-methylase UbiE
LIKILFLYIKLLEPLIQGVFMQGLAVYNNIGADYNQTRRADPKIVQQLISYLNPIEPEKYLDIGCGTGNYTSEIKKSGVNICGIDLSQVMITQAKNKYPYVEWHIGSAEDLCFDSKVFNGVTIVNALQHFSDWRLVLKESHRVISNGRLVIFTPTQEQLRSYWLNHYFPTMMKKAIEQMPKTNDIIQHLINVGFNSPDYYPYFIADDLEDLFLYCGKNRPLIYSDPSVTNNIGTFALFSNPLELETGLTQLKEDINTGRFDEIKYKHSSSIGDCSFIVASTKFL